LLNYHSNYYLSFHLKLLFVTVYLLSVSYILFSSLFLFHEICIRDQFVLSSTDEEYGIHKWTSDSKKFNNIMFQMCCSRFTDIILGALLKYSFKKKIMKFVLKKVKVEFKLVNVYIFYCVQCTYNCLQHIP